MPSSLLNRKLMAEVAVTSKGGESKVKTKQPIYGMLFFFVLFFDVYKTLPLSAYSAPYEYCWFFPCSYCSLFAFGIFMRRLHKRIVVTMFNDLRIFDVWEAISYISLLEINDVMQWIDVRYGLNVCEVDRFQGGLICLRAHFSTKSQIIYLNRNVAHFRLNVKAMCFFREKPAILTIKHTWLKNYRTRKIN